MHKSIRARVTRCVVAIIISVVCVLTIFNVYYTSTNLLAKTQNQITIETQRYAQEIDVWVNKQCVLVEGVANAIIASGKTDEVTYGAIIRQFYAANDEVFNLYIGTPTGKAYFGKPDYVIADDYDPCTRSWYKMAAEAGHTVVVNPYKSFAYDMMLATFATPVYLNGELVAVVGLDVSLDAITELVGSINYEKGEYGFLIDSEGFFVVHPNSEYEPKQDGSTKVEAVMPQLKSLIENPNSTGVLKAKDYDGTKVYFAATSIGDTGWIIAISIPVNNILGHIRHIVGISFLISLAFLIVAALGMIAIVTRLLSPIDNMVDAMARLSEGDFEVGLDFSKNDDEIAKLQRSISNLIGILSSVIEEENYILGEIAMGNLDVEDMEGLPGRFDDLALSINSISMAINDLVKDIKDSAINVQSTAMALEMATDPVEIQAVVKELTVEANNLMDKVSSYKTRA